MDDQESCAETPLQLASAAGGVPDTSLRTPPKPLSPYSVIHAITLNRTTGKERNSSQETQS